MEKPAPPPRDDLVFGVEMSRRSTILNSVTLALVGAVAVGFLWLMSSLPLIEGSVPIHGLELPATVSRDGAGIPRIAARSVHDAYFVLGWVHAQDRMWQMELQRRVTAGRLAEIAGPAGLANDRFMRTLGLHRLAEQGVAALDKPTRDALDAYAAGVNAWLGAHRLRLPPEFHLLGVVPEPWTPADTLAWGRLMGLQLAGNWRDDILRARLAARLPPARLAELFPGYPADAPVTLAATTANRILAAIPPVARPRLESNVWVVSGRLTASGKPLLANDPHLAFQAPILWYLATIDAPGLTVSGATVPGEPFVLAGHNRRIAWGVTSTAADTVDLFVEKLAADGASTLGPDGPRPITIRHEVIKVRGGADVALTVRDTADGPVVSDLIPSVPVGADQVVALRSTALEPDDRTAQALHRLQRAGDWRSFVAAIRDVGAPVENFAYADTGGDIGFATAGRVPVRRSGDGSLPAAGWTGQGAWTGWIPFADLPRALNPKSGIIVNANNPVGPPAIRARLAADWPDGYRAQRIADMLAGRTGLRPGDMAAMQMDTLSLADVQMKALLAATRPTTGLAQEAARMVAAWDGHADRDRPEPLIFNAWIRQLWHDLLAGPLGREDFAAFGPIRPAVLAGILTRHQHWCAEAAPDLHGCDELAARSLEVAVAELAARHGNDPHAWTWGSEHHAVFANPVLAPVFGRLPLVSRLIRLSVATGGDDFTVNRGTFRADDFTQVHGAGLRAVYDLADLADSRLVIATGESGNLLSRHYDDLLADWAANRGHAIAATAAGPAVLSLEPGY